MSAANLNDLETIAAKGCQIPNCDHKNHDSTFFLHQSCHPGTTLEVSYTLGSGHLRVSCAKCQKPLGHFLLSRKRAYNDFEWSTLPLNEAKAELSQRIYEAARMLEILEYHQRLNGTDLGQDLMDFADKLLESNWNNAGVAPAPSKDLGELLDKRALAISSDGTNLPEAGN